MSISDNIRTIRVAKGLKQSDLAKALDIETSNYNRFENRGDKLTIEQVKRIANALGVTLGELLGYEDAGLPKELEMLRERIKELEKENERLTETLGFVRQLMDLANQKPQQIAQLENDLFDGDLEKKERIKKKVIGRIENSDKETQ
ncbi:hypothetical protein GCM10028805_46160 [Spirosoma harenae]